VAIHELLGGDEGQDAAWRLTLVGIDQLLADLGLDPAARLDVARSARASLKKEHRAGVPTERALGALYRREGRALAPLFDPAHQEQSELWPGFEILRRRSAAIAPVVAALREAETAGQLTRTVRDMAWDYCHMFANRMLRSAARAQEMVLYDLLARLHESRAARRRAAER